MNLEAISEAMIELGYSEAQILALVLKMEEKRKEKARASNAERQQRFRARNAVTPVTQITDVTRDSVTEPRAYKERACADGNPNPSLRSGLLVTPLPSEGPQGGRSRSRSSAGSALPDDWAPPEELFAYGADLGLTRAQTGEIVEGMRLWAHANRNRPIARKADWMATMKGAIRRDAAKAKARAGPATHRNGLGAIAAKLWGQNDDRETEIAGETALRLPLNGEPKRAPDASHAGVVSGNAVGLLIEGSFKRM